VSDASSIKAPYLPYPKLIQIAEQFRRDYNVADKVPVPIEAIVEFGFGMDIVPIPGVLANYEVDGWLSADQITIYVDEFIYKKRPTRYRFSLAHELSHKILHGSIFQQLSFSTTAEWKAAMAAIDPTQYGWLESHAYGLAGLVLVPCDHLRTAFDEMSVEAAAAGVTFDAPTDVERKMISRGLGEIFDVSSDVIRRRLTKAGLWTATQ
jgi:Zn-dependent peptidase ImmA (M78 family)